MVPFLGRQKEFLESRLTDQRTKVDERRSRDRSHLPWHPVSLRRVVPAIYELEYDTKRFAPLPRSPRAAASERVDISKGISMGRFFTKWFSPSVEGTADGRAIKWLRKRPGGFTVSRRSSRYRGDEMRDSSGSFDVECETEMWKLRDSANKHFFATVWDFEYSVF